MADIATLGLRLDANGFIADANRANEAVNRLGTTSNQSTAHFGRMRGALTQVALAASGVPGPMGRLASVMGQFALGGGLTVGVLAGLGAISIAWNKYTEGLRKADEMMAKIRQQRLGFSGPALTSTIEISHVREARLAAELADIQSRRGGTFLREGPIGLALNIMEQERATQRLADEREFLAAATIAAAKAERDLGIEVGRSNDDRKRTAEQGKMQWGLGGLVDLARARSPWNPLAGNMQTLALAKERNAQDEVNESIAAARKLRGDNLIYTLASIANEKKVKDAIAEGNYELAKRLTIAGQKSGAKMQVANYGIGLVASAAGPFGGMVQGVGSGLLSGDPWAAAAGGITGLVGGLFSLGSASAQARAALRAFQLELGSWIDQADLRTGRMSQKDYDIAQHHREAEAQRQALASHYDPRVRSGFYPGKAHDDYQRALDLINQKEKELIEARQKEADAIDSLTTGYRNAPTGFFVESYLQRIGAGGGTGPGWEGPYHPPGGTTTFGGGGGHRGASITVESLTVMLPPGSTQQQVDAFVKALDAHASATGGTGMTRSQALDRISVN